METNKTKMSKPGRKPSSRATTISVSEEKKNRLKKALRENLKKRKVRSNSRRHHSIVDENKSY
tara:strand:- start:52 stop:240 length:189 start_codon:yes stop_codon:yes gene_type:complete